MVSPAELNTACQYRTYCNNSTPTGVPLLFLIPSRAIDFESTIDRVITWWIESFYSFVGRQSSWIPAHGLECPQNDPAAVT